MGETENTENVLKATAGELDLVDGIKPTLNSRSPLDPLQRGLSVEQVIEIPLLEVVTISLIPFPMLCLRKRAYCVPQHLNKLLFRKRCP
jgi:hypothetical protein